MKRHRRTAAGLGAAVTAAMTLLVAPTPTLGDGLPVLDEVERAVDQVTTIGRAHAPAPRTRATPSPVQAPTGVGTRQTPGSGGYQPPLHGANPHGQGTVATLDVQPSGTRPLAGDPTGAGDQPADREEVVVGRARGEQREDGRYRGHVTIVALFGNEVVGRDTEPGETEAGPLDPIQTNVLDQLCSGSGDEICLEVLRADSATTENGSTNSFAVASARIGGAQGISTGVAESNGNISEEGGCQTAHGDSTVARASAGGNAVADVATSTSDSRAGNCGDAPPQENGGRVIGLGGQAVPLPAEGCGNGEADTPAGIPTIAPIVCNATDSNGTNEAITQAAAPYGVREALTVFALEAGGTALLKATTAASESRAAAPAQAPPAGPEDGDVSDGGPLGPEEEAPRDDDDGPFDDTTTIASGGPGAGGPGDDGPAARGSLAQTGVDALLIALLGLIALRIGLALHTLAGREAIRPAR